MPIRELTESTFKETIADNDTVIVDFWAPWCAPCRNFAPIYEQVAENHEDVVFAKVNTEEQQNLAGVFQIRSIPTLMVFRLQTPIFVQPGALPAQALESLIAEAKAVDQTMLDEAQEAANA
ncbi:MAG: thioredoxin [Gammaproteobacteria bacterium]|nr:MAG: thioredoxin [Gammaproteobacteria bacterium]